MFNIRKDRLGQQLQQEIAMVIHQELKDPGLGFVTITKVDLSNDLSHAKVNFSCLGGNAERVRSQEALERSVGFIRNLLKKRLRLKMIPEIVFRYDETIALALDITAKLDALKTEPPQPSS